jgi:hypothetical protein
MLNRGEAAVNMSIQLTQLRSLSGRCYRLSRFWAPSLLHPLAGL